MTGKRERGAWRFLGSIFSVAVGITLLLSAFCSSRFAARDWDFVLKSPWMAPWAQTWIRRGDSARFQDLDTARAVEAYWQGVGRNPLLLGGWFALARLERQLEAGIRADALHDFLINRVPPSTPWRWHQLLLAADRKDDAAFAEAFNFVLNRLPEHRQEALQLALGFWSGWPEILGRTASENKWTVLEECMARQAVDACTELYSHLETDESVALDAVRQTGFIEFLLANTRWAEAAQFWRRSDLFQGTLVSNGQFETPLSGTAFDWRLGRLQGVEVRREPRRGAGEGQAMRFHFLGTTNLRYDHCWQYVPIQPGTHYELRFVWKSERLSTDQGVYMDVRGAGCDALSVQSPAITGNRDWSEETLVFLAPEGCRMARIGMKRDESLKFDNKIAGDVWLDAVEMIEKRVQP
jgi:hypothetical protein